MKIDLSTSFHLFKGFDFSLINKENEDFKIASIYDFPYLDDKCDIYTYSKYFKFQKDDNEVIILNVNDTYYEASVYLNGLLLGNTSKVCPRNTFDVSNIIKEDNHLVIVVKNEHRNYFDYSLSYDENAFYGLNGEIFLQTHHKTYINDININYGKADGSFYFDVDVIGSDPYTLNYRLLAKGKTVLTFDKRETKLPFVHIYEFDDPYLYDLEVTLKTKKYQEVKSMKLAFLDTLFTKGSFRLNDKKRFLYGLKIVLNNTLSYREKKIIYSNFYSLKEAGINLLLLNSTLINESILDLLDRLGIFFILELPNFIDDDYYKKDDYINSVTEYIKLCRNHVCLLGYYITTNNDEAIDITYKLLKTIDRRRVITSKNKKHPDDDYIFLDRLISKKEEKELKEQLYTKSTFKYFYSSDHTLFTSKITLNSEINNTLNYLQKVNESIIANDVGLIYVSYINKIDSSVKEVCEHALINDYILEALKVSFAKENSLKVINPPMIYKSPYTTYNKLVIFSNCDYIKMYINHNYVDSYYPTKDKYENINDKPIFIDDIYLKTYKDEKYSKNDNELLAISLDKMSKETSSIADFLKIDEVKNLVFKKILTIENLLSFYTEAVIFNSLEADYIFEGYKNDVVAISKEYKLSSKRRLKLVIDQKIILDSILKVIKADIFLVDENDNILNDTQGILQIDTIGDIKLIGESHVDFELGRKSIYLEANKTGSATIKVSYAKLETSADVVIKGENIND